MVVDSIHGSNSVGSIPALPIYYKKLSNIMVLYLFAKQIVWVRFPSQLFIYKKHRGGMVDAPYLGYGF